MEAWTDGAAYEAYVGRWSRLVAREFLARIDVSGGKRWLDLGCGTGSLSEAILSHAAPSEVSGVDASNRYVEIARARVGDERATFQVADALEVPFPDQHFDACVSGLVLNFLPTTESALAEMSRVVRAGGVIGAYVWDYSGEMQIIRRFWDAAIDLRVEATALDEGRRFPICDQAALERVFTAAGLESVQTGNIDVETRFVGFEDYWSPLLGGQGPAPGYVASLDGPQRDALQERLRSTLPTSEDGSIALIARAIMVHGVLPDRR